MASKMLWIFGGPRLLRIYKNGEVEGHDYNPGYLETLPDRVVRSINVAFGMTYWFSPIVGGILYRRGYFTQEGSLSLFKVALSMSIVYAAAYLLRGFGRISNPDYRAFIGVLTDTRNNPTYQNKKQLAGYDFEFWAWPVDYTWDQETAAGEKKKPAGSSHKPQATERSNILYKCLSYLAMHSFGRRMVYPGGTTLMNYLLSSMLQSGRKVLVEEKNGQRAKVKTEDGNEIDTMFVDRRGKFQNGTTLVITSEGNAGFYEMGCSGTPLDLNYSVLGWNHPGFGGSTGIPFPEQEQKAIDAVMQYAINKLGFKPENIALFAWSIGGYPAAWLAKNYPDVQFVLLDATFDDIVPLAVSKMPQSWGNLVGLSLRTYMDLNVAEQLLGYNGPVMLVRRTRDEIITTEAPPQRPPVLLSNRGNYLLIKLLQFRYPTIVDHTTLPTIKMFLSKEGPSKTQMLDDKKVDPEACNNFFKEMRDVEFPMSVDVKDQTLKERLALFLVAVHLKDFESTHCTPLPGSHFHKPWAPGSKL